MDSKYLNQRDGLLYCNLASKHYTMQHNLINKTCLPTSYPNKTPPNADIHDARNTKQDCKLQLLSVRLPAGEFVSHLSGLLMSWLPWRNSKCDGNSHATGGTEVSISSSLASKHTAKIANCVKMQKRFSYGPVFIRPSFHTEQLI